ncbi:MAG: helix-turn-helix transcriptional regulator [Ruminococcaceae bacterium]|nr:helix-turn-helix transcriptional regulator [Oscillospiraceae bacterium]
MFKTKTDGGSNNLCGKNVYLLRKSRVPKMSQRALAEKLQLYGMDVDKNAVQRIECGKRFVTDIELVALAQALSVAIEELLK